MTISGALERAKDGISPLQDVHQGPHQLFYVPEFCAVLHEYQDLARAGQDNKVLDEYVAERQAQTLQRLNVRVMFGCTAHRLPIGRITCPSYPVRPRYDQMGLRPAAS